ncbi:hypothetical protein [Bernardetia sp.]|uniref:hypothetical protein n=1 Tax=Bernardetia sp. TaxID=1937974 RepID=UPI0025C5688E|nr:hypothetical protein [Bernardetia sp.]
MPIIRSKHQAGETIEEFYANEDVGMAFVMTGKVMLKLIKFINDNVTETKLSVFTSHYTMCIQTKDSKRLNDFITINADPISDTYYFSYKLPTEKSPWKNAWVSGTAKGVEEGLIFLIKSMIGTEKWKGNKELEQLAKKYNIYQKD